MPSLANGSYINIPPANVQDIQDLAHNDNDPPMGGPTQPHEINPIANDNDLQQLDNNPSTSEPPSRTNSNTMRTSNNLLNSMESPLSSPPPISNIQPSQTSATTSPTTLSPFAPVSGGGGQVDSENNNILNGFLPSMLPQANDNVTQEKPKTNSDFRTNKPPALDLFTNQHIFPQRYSTMFEDYCYVKLHKIMVSCFLIYDSLL